jgi:diguanylate cyclase
MGMGIIRQAIISTKAWLFPAIPDTIRNELALAQYDNVRRHMPMLLLIAALNIVIIMAVCAHDQMPFVRYGWLSLLILFCLGRFLYWSRILHRDIDPAKIPGILRANTRTAVIMTTLLGLDAAITFLVGMFKSPLLIPISLTFGAMAIAHCLYALRPAAICALVMGIFPSAIAMLVVGSFEAQMLGLSMVSVAVLMLRFVVAQNQTLVTRLLLEREIHELAHTDPLTGLANRRAMMAALEDEVASARPFAVALVDLDGFKQVNDRFGHHAGDNLLRVVARRLDEAAQDYDEVGRLGGDEFLILFRNVDGIADCSARATGLLAALCQPVEQTGQRLGFGACLGFARWADDGNSVEELLHSADSALYAAKRSASDSGAICRSFRLAA